MGKGSCRKLSWWMFFDRLIRVIVDYMTAIKVLSWWMFFDYLITWYSTLGLEMRAPPDLFKWKGEALLHSISRKMLRWRPPRNNLHIFMSLPVVLSKTSQRWSEHKSYANSFRSYKLHSFSWQKIQIVS